MRERLPDDLIPLADVAAKIPGTTLPRLRLLSRRKNFPDIFAFDRGEFVSQAEVDAWQRGNWDSFRVMMADAALRAAGLPPLKRNRRAR